MIYHVMLELPDRVVDEQVVADDPIDALLWLMTTLHEDKDKIKKLSIKQL